MNFETKYLIRWGIPGWIILLYIIILLTLNSPIEVINSLTKKPIEALGFIIAMSGIGVPLGYIMYQLYFGFNWVSKKDKQINKITSCIDNYTRKYSNDELEYMRIEYLWQSELSLLDDDKRNYIAERYRHLISTTHSMGALAASLFISFLISLFIIEKIKLGLLDSSIIIISEVLLIGVTALNCKYYSDLTKNFQGSFLNEFINDENRNNQRKCNI
ncbi:hypothetical protein [Cytobacillus firmus]|uniref:hypothetical protein n=1 Tax=Cytobacillus firmus TaxID=1399 RepID=UPI002495864C|nr:hypothetical protein [Cytobacillus firmus]